jgi:4-aminobutyrate aminotransferase-like enzyme
MLQSRAPEAAGELAGRLCARGGGRLTNVYFGSSGSEGIEAVVRFARAHTGRAGILHAGGSFQGLTCEALLLMGSSVPAPRYLDPAVDGAVRSCGIVYGGRPLVRGNGRQSEGQEAEP